jgi:methionyl aminopeptidase
MILLKSDHDIELTKQASRICADTLDLLSSFVRPGKTGLEVDKLAEEYIRSMGGVPSCKGYKGFPASLCLSVNAGAVHCIPNNNPIKEGDVVKIDLVVNYQGFNADSAITVLVPPVKPDVQKLVETTYNAMLRGVEQAIEGKTVLDISQAIFDARNGCGVIKEFSGHGIGRDIHESPQIPNYPVKEKNTTLVSGMLLCIEPIFCIGDPAIFYDPKQWDTWVLSGQPVAHFEHTVLVTSQKPQILTLRSDEVNTL